MFPGPIPSKGGRFASCTTGPSFPGAFPNRGGGTLTARTADQAATPRPYCSGTQPGRHAAQPQLPPWSRARCRWWDTAGRPGHLGEVPFIGVEHTGADQYSHALAHRALGTQLYGCPPGVSGREPARWRVSWLLAGNKNSFNGGFLWFGCCLPQ